MGGRGNAMTSSDSRKTKPQGMALMVVLIILAILSIIAFYLHQFSTRQRDQSHRLSSSEIALHAAYFAAKQSYHLLRRSVDFINSSSPETFPKKCETAPESLREFFIHFVSPEGRIKDENIQILLHNESFELIKRTLLEEYPNNLDLKILITHERLTNPLLETTPIDGLEKGLEGEHCGRFIIDVKVTFSGVSRRVLMVINERSVQMTWPVIGRFVLYANQMGPNPIDASVNRIAYKLTDSTSPKMIESFDLENNSLKPLVVISGESVSASRHGDISADPETSANFLNGQGWILLGGQDVTLGVAPGKGEYGEHFLLANDIVFLKDIVRNSVPFGFETLHPDQVKFPAFRFKLWETHEVYSILTGIYQETRDNIRKHFLEEFHDADLRSSSLLRLMGTQNNQSPTMVFGNVFRRYILEQGLRVKMAAANPPTSDSISAVCPYIPNEIYDQPQWMKGFNAIVTKIIKETNGNSWERGYRNVMSTPLKTSFNEGLACWLAPPMAPNALEDKGAMLSGFTTGNISKLGKPLSFSPPGTPEKLLMGLENAYSLFRGATPVFNGRFQEILPSIRNLALARCGRSFESDRDLQKYLRSTLENKGSTVGYYHVKKPFKWTEEWNSLALGGCGIVCDGAVTVAASVKPHLSPLFPDATKNMMTFVALNGDITVATEQPVEASLLAPSGRLSLSGGCNIKGLVAVNNLDVSSFANTQVKYISYDIDHDWADESSFNKGFRTMLEQQPIIFTAKPN